MMRLQFVVLYRMRYSPNPDFLIPAMPLPAPTPELITEFAANGAVVVRGLADPTAVAALARGIDHNMRHPSPRAKTASRSDDGGWFFEDFCNWQHIPAYRDFIFNTGVAAVAGQLMQSRETRLYHDHTLVKTAGTRQRTPWHQDQPYYNIEGRQNISLWLPVDPVPREATLEFVAGSHLGPWLMPRSFMDNQAKWFPEGSLADLPDIEADRSAYPIIGWALEPGDAVFFHMLTLHAAQGSERLRRVFSVRFLGDDITHAPRNWVTSPEFPGLSERLPAGAPMHDDDLFPLLYRAA
ncbi:ectoine hydroxylase-related dioxygenase (phytanoyl-CoA dioxygenase family) [Neisseria sp. HSC-16F19]|nr:phytanoyl-CoA dioxygenase family protein [Neisseria sp. HSC-16F19]MCP2041303.1 ectoine hydroxylase-related dioxygenase (phytanoyl-CoA dioxygenase family) [Neisseria sp. HSC-16F19]